MCVCVSALQSFPVPCNSNIAGGVSCTVHRRRVPSRGPQPSGSWCCLHADVTVQELEAIFSGSSLPLYAASSLVKRTGRTGGARLFVALSRREHSKCYSLGMCFETEL